MLTKLGHVVYKAIPFQGGRKIVFDAYARMVSKRWVVKKVEDVNFRLDLGELIDLAIYLEKFERHVVDAIQRYCKPGMTVLDIGANIGAHTLRLANIVGPSGHVHAFEPTKFAFNKLLDNIRLNPLLKITPQRIALSDHAEFNCPISFRASWRTDGQHQDTSCSVDFVLLDEWVVGRDIKKVDLIKIDVDGNEFGVLSGGRRLLMKDKPILLMELVGPHFANSHRNPFLLLEEMGYKFKNIDSNIEYSGVNEMAGLISASDSSMTTSINILATPADFR